MVENKNNEIYFVLVKMSTLTFNFGIIYIPNKSNENIYSKYFNTIKLLYEQLNDSDNFPIRFS